MSSLICSYMRNVKPTYKARKCKATGRQRTEKDSPKTPSLTLGHFSSLPKEMCFYIFARIPLVDLGNISLTSKAMRDSVLDFIRSTQGLHKILPSNLKSDENKENYMAEVLLLDDALKYSDHFGDLGIYSTIYL